MTKETAQPEQEPLTLDAISQLIDACEANEKKEFLVELVRAVEAAHNIKENT